MKLLLALILTFSSFANLTDDPSIEINDFDIISSSFPSGSFDSTKLELIINEIRGRQTAAFLGYCMSNLPEEATDNNYCLNVNKSDLNNGWNSNLYNRTYHQIINLLNSAIGIGRDMVRSDFSTKEGKEFLKKVSLALQIYENTKKGPLIPKDVKTFDSIGKLGSFFGIYSIKDPKNALEAPQELPKINKSLFLTNETRIVEETSEEIDTVLDFNGSTNFPFVVNYRGEKWAIRFPTEVLDVPRDLDTLDGVRFKIRPNTPQVGHVLKRLARELGYNVVPSMFKKTVRIRFSQQDLEGSSFELQKTKLLAKLSETYPQEILPKSILDDSKDYIELKGIALEKIYDENNFLSFNGFPLSSGGNEYRREYRALALFAAWVDLPFLDDSIGAGVFDVKNSKLLHLLYNLDYGLGYGYPNLFREKLVRKVHRKNGTVTKIDLTYKPFKKTDLFKKMNLSDAKWMAEKISHIKPDFLKNIFLKSGFPEMVAEIFVRKLMDRRNQILEALDLINEQTPLEEGWNKTLPGLEKYFNKDGFLIDPDEELTKLVESPFPIYWSTTWFAKIGNHGFNRVAFKNYGRRLLSTVNSFGMGNLHLGPGYFNNGFTFQEFASNGNNPFTPCAIGSCFFQVLNIGAGVLLPYRFVIENPDKASKKRFLIVDIFRLAIKVGVGSEFYNTLGISPIGLQPIGNVSTFSVFEFVKVHPTDNFKEYTQGYGEGMKIPGLPIFGLQQKFIESMEEDDSIMINKYIGLGGTIGAGWSAPIGVVSANFGLDAGVILLSGKILHKNKGDNVVLNFSKITAKQLSLFARLEAVGFIDHNLLATGANLTLRDVNKKDEVFLFNLKNEADHKMLMESVKKITARSIPDEYRLSERIIHSKNSDIGTRFTSFMGHERKTKKIEAQFQNFTDGSVQKELSYVRRLETYLNKNQRIYDFKASLNEKGDLYFKVKTFIKFNNVKKERFLKFYPMIKKLTPDDFIVFDLNAVDEDLGDIEFNSIAIVSGEGIKKLLGFSNFQICNAYLEGEDEEQEERIECDKSNYPIGLKLLISDLEKTREEFKELGPNPDKKSVFGVLKKLVNLHVHHYKNESLIKLFKTLIPREDFFQASTLHSSNAAFPGKIDEINLSRINKGAFSPSVRHLADTVEQAYSIFSDQLIFSLRNYLYFKDPSLDYPRTGFLNQQL
jgi:hypothetical protein